MQRATKWLFKRHAAICHYKRALRFPQSLNPSLDPSLFPSLVPSLALSTPRSFLLWHSPGVFIGENLCPSSVSVSVYGSVSVSASVSASLCFTVPV